MDSEQVTSVTDLEIDRELARAIQEAMHVDRALESSSTWLRSFLTERIEALSSTGRHPRYRDGSIKPFGPRSLFEEIFGNWNAVPEPMKDIIQSNKTLKDPLGRAHNRLAKTISDIQRTTPRFQKVASPLRWEDLLRFDLEENREDALERLFRLLADHGTPRAGANQMSD